MIRIIIADDHPIVRRGLVEIVAQESDMKVLGEAGTVDELLDLLKQHKTDIVLLDLNMPGKHGLEALRTIKIQFKTPRVLVLSGYPEDQFAQRVLKAGAYGYLSKDSAPDLLVGAIRKVYKGGRFVSLAFAEKFAGQLEDSSARPKHESLSDREFQVLLLIAGGKSVTDIGEQLSLSAKTISTYRTRILSKLNAKSNADLTRYAIENKLIE